MKALFRKILSYASVRSNLTLCSCKSYTKDNSKKNKHKLYSYILTRYVNLVKSCEDTFDKNFPAAAKVYKTFSLGIKEFKDDILLLFKVYRKVNVEGIYSLTRKELEVYSQMPKEMIRVAPVLIIGSGVPLGATIFGLAYMFPKQMLSYHFWSTEQRIKFLMIDHKKRLNYNDVVLCCMKQGLSAIKNAEQKVNFSTVLDYLQNGTHPTVEEILKCKCLFKQHPFGMPNLGSFHAVSLLKMHNMHNMHLGWRKRKRLQDLATTIHALDLALIKEGGVESLSQDELKWTVFFRGLNPVNMKNEDIVNWLRNWLLISNKIDENCFSLLLHCPILLAHNQPSNKALLINNCR